MARNSRVPIAFAQKLYDRYDEQFPGLASWSRKLTDWAESMADTHDDFTITTMYGRKVPIDVHKPYVIVNYSIQPVARDILVDWLFAADDNDLIDGHLLAVVHDELVTQFSPSEATEAARLLASTAAAIDVLTPVPVVADVKVAGNAWGSAYLKDLPPTDFERLDSDD